jgi:YD repeat-containing protein
MRFPGSNPSYGGVGDDNNNNDNDYTGSSTPPKAFESDSWTNKYAELRRPDGWVSANNIGDDYSVFITTANSPNTTAILSKIQISDIGFEINFNYKTDTIIDYSYENYVSIQPFLNTIQLKIDEEIKTCTLTRIESSCYELNTSPWKTEYRKKYYFLSKINTFKGTEYKFNYNTECDLPTSGQLFVDDYGFSKKNPQFGIITSMTDELGGKTCFTFEKHKYAKMKIYGLTSDYRTDILLETNPKQDLYNNFRIKKIETKDEYDNLVEKKEYNYNRYETNLAMYESYASGASSNNAYVNPNVNAVDDTNIINYNPNASSGLLHCDFAVKYNDATYGVFGRAILKSSEPYAVTYSKVTETVSFTDKKYKNVYYFPTYEELPDIFEENNIDLCNIEFFREKFWFYGCNSMSHRRGLLKQKDEYEGLSLLKRRTLYKYQPLNIGENAENFILFGDALKMYYAPTNTTKIITTEFLNGNEISTETQFDYDFRNRLSEKRTVDIDGKTYFTKYRYADDIIQLRLYGTASQDGLTPVERDYSGFAGGLQQIQRQGWLGKPVEVVSGFYENDVKYYTGGMISLFKKPSGNTNMQADFHPIHAENPAYYLSSPLPYVPTHTAPFATLSREISLTLGEPVADYQFMQNNGGSIVFDSRYKTVADYEYNNKLRLTKIIPDNAPETTYTWDRRNLYPVFETTNGFTTAFTYKLMIGLTSKTDPRGVTTYFDYDFLGRLIETSIKNTSGQKEKLQNYEYHYKK